MSIFKSRHVYNNLLTIEKTCDKQSNSRTLTVSSMTSQKVDEPEEQLKKHIKLSYWTGNDTYKGYVLCKGFKRLQESIENFEVYDDDVWVTSFPKCGTTWMQYLVWCIRNRSNLSMEEFLHQAYSFLELSCVYLPEGPKVSPGLQGSVETAASKPRPRFIKTHLPWDLLPKQIRTFNKRPKIIHVTRDIRHVCVSYFYHYKLFKGFTGSFELFWKLFVSKNVGLTVFLNLGQAKKNSFEISVMYCPPVPTILGYYNKRSEPNVLFIKYEDMQSNLKSVLVKVVDFLEEKLSLDNVENILPRLSFKAMKENRLVNYKQAVEDISKTECFPEKVVNDLNFIRKGKCGDHKVEMTNDMVEIMNRDIMLPLRKAGLEF